MFWKKKTDIPVLDSVTFEMSLSINIDSSLDDKEIVNYIKKQMKEYFSSDFLLTIDRIERDSNGKICALRNIKF